MSVSIDILETVKENPQLFIAVDLGEPCSPSNDLSKLTTDFGEAWILGTDAFGDIQLDGMLDVSSLFLKLDNASSTAAIADQLEKLAAHLRKEK